MSVVVSDATPINVLIRIGRAEVLGQLFGEVVVPQAVFAELTHLSTPQVVSATVRSEPKWMVVRTVSVPDMGPPQGRGEREAIALAKEIGATLLLVDDKAARSAAVQAGLKIVGTLGVLLQASRAGLCDLRKDVEQLRAIGFFVHEDLLERLLREDAPPTADGR
jgi:predicted nucleic acid-binding protein